MAQLLLVANDRQEAAELASALGELGHITYVESSAAAALTCLENEVIDALVCDEVLPGILGKDLVTRARGVLARPHLPAVILSELPARLRMDVPVPDRVTVLPVPVAAAQIADAISQFSLAPEERRTPRMTSEPSTADRPLGSGTHDNQPGASS